MNQKIAILIADIARDNGIDIRMRASYSGRGMMGETTAALIGEWSELCAACALAGKFDSINVDIEELVESIRDIREDNLGKERIFY